MTPPWHLSYLDRLLLDGLVGAGPSDQQTIARAHRNLAAVFLQRQKAHVLRSALAPARRETARARPADASDSYYPEIKKAFRQREDYFEGQVQTWLDSFDLSDPDTCRSGSSWSSSSGRHSPKKRRRRTPTSRSRT